MTARDMPEPAADPASRDPRGPQPAWWQQLNAEICSCQRCPRLTAYCQSVAQQKRAAWRDQVYWGRPVPNFGDHSGRLLIVGLAPAAHGANRTGRMFTGDRSGDWLYRALHRAGFASQPQAVAADDGLQLTDCMITSACHCAPPDNKPTTAEVQACGVWLDRLLDHQHPEVVVALGGLAWNVCWQAWQRRAEAEQQPAAGTSATAAAGRSQSIARRLDAALPGAASAVSAAAASGSRGRRMKKPRFGHGAEARLSESVLLLGSYHPSQQNTFTGRLTEAMLDSIFQRARSLLSGRSGAGG